MKARTAQQTTMVPAQYDPETMNYYNVYFEHATAAQEVACANADDWGKPVKLVQGTEYPLGTLTFKAMLPGPSMTPVQGMPVFVVAYKAPWSSQPDTHPIPAGGPNPLPQITSITNPVMSADGKTIVSGSTDASGTVALTFTVLNPGQVTVGIIGGNSNANDEYTLTADVSAS